MSFLKDFKDELSQAVNELVSTDEVEVKNNEKEDNTEMAKQKKQKEASDKDVKIQEENQSEDQIVNTLDEQGDHNDVDMSMLNELFGNNSSDEKDEEEIESQEKEAEINEEDNIKFDNIDISDYLDESASDNQTESSLLKDLSEDIKDNLEEDNDLEKEATKAALRGNSMSNDNTKEEESSLASEDVAEVTKGTMIEGNIISEGSMNVYGKIKGNVACRGKLVVCGTIIGSSRAADIFTNNAKIDGDVTSDGSIKIGNGTVIIGNIYGSSAVIAGAVQGDIDIHGPVVIDGTAVIQGNIRSRSVQINNGAAIEGMISQCYAEIDYAALFDKTFSK